MNAEEKRAICEVLWQAVEVESQIQELKALEASVKNLHTTVQSLQQDDCMIQMDSCCAHAASIQGKLEELERKKQNHLEKLSKFQEISDVIGISADNYWWYNNLLALWNNVKESEKDLRSHEARVKVIIARLDNLTSIHKSKLASGIHWQNTLLASLWELVQLTQKLKDAHNLKVKIKGAVDPSLDLRLAQVSDRINKVEKSYLSCHEEVEKVKETIAKHKIPSSTGVIASQCVMAMVSTLMPPLINAFEKNMQAFCDKMVTYRKAQIQMINAATDLTEFDAIIKAMHPCTQTETQLPPLDITHSCSMSSE